MTKQTGKLVLACLMACICPEMALGGAFAYAAEGYATYYTTASCQREGNSGLFTASGRAYNEGEMTCALPTRDFGKHWLVCGPKGCADVEHTDYGPGKGPRVRGVIVDLTPTAFKQICGDLRQGRCEVQMQEIIA